MHGRRIDSAGRNSEQRVARAYEIHAETRRDLLQDMQIALWNSLDGFDGRCSLRTWVFRVAHNIGAKHGSRASRRTRAAALF